MEWEGEGDYAVGERGSAVGAGAEMVDSWGKE